MIGKVLNKHVIVEGKDVYSLLDRGYGAKLHLSSIRPSNVLTTETISVAGQTTIKFSTTTRKVEENDEMQSSSDESIDVIILRDEEAFYLCAKGCLSIENNSLSQLWTIFTENNAKFCIYYKVYEFFKEKGYVVKGGINYGVEFSVYRTIPLWCHSEICVVVEDSRCSGPESETLSWNHVCTQSRITQDVMKTLMVCYVVMKSTISHSSVLNWDDASCLDAIEVRPMIFTNRRHNLNEEFLTASEIQSKHAALSILRRPRQLVQMKRVKKAKQKSVHVPIKKRSSKHNKVWNNLQKPIQIINQPDSIN